MYLYERIAQEKERQKKLEEMYCQKEVHKPDKRYVALMSSMSHTYGNALAFIQNWIMSIFPENMFKTIHVNSKIAHRQLRSTPHEFVKKTKPMIIFRPRIPGISEDRFLKGTTLIERQTDLYSTWGATNLQPFFEDQQNDLVMKYQLNRTVMYVDVIVVLSTLMQQLDYYHYLENAIRIDKPFFLQTALESYLPEDMLQIISDCVKIPVTDDKGNTKEFLDYMNGKSMYPITYKLQGSTQRREFFRYYPVNIDTIITDLDKDDGDRVGSIMDQYTLSFTVRIEFNSTGFYYIFSDNLHDIKMPIIHPEDSDIIPVYTDVFLKEDLNLRQGWQLYNRGSCRLEDIDDSVDFDQMLNESIRECMKYHKANGLLYSEFIDIKRRKQGKMITEGIEYTIDWEQRKINFIKQNTYSTYTIMLCLNIEYINNLIKTLYKLK